jgi:hypothetical protein
MFIKILKNILKLQNNDSYYFDYILFKLYTQNINM